MAKNCQSSGSRVGNVLPYDGVMPTLGRDVFIAPGAYVIGQVTLGDESSDRDVDVVGRATEHADGVPRLSIEGAMTALQVVVAQRDEVARVDQIAGLGVFDQAVVGVLVLVVEVVGHAVQRPGQSRLAGHVDAPTVVKHQRRAAGNGIA